MVFQCNIALKGTKKKKKEGENKLETALWYCLQCVTQGGPYPVCLHGFHWI